MVDFLKWVKPATYVWLQISYSHVCAAYSCYFLNSFKMCLRACEAPCSFNSASGLKNFTVIVHTAMIKLFNLELFNGLSSLTGKPGKLIEEALKFTRTT